MTLKWEYAIVDGPLEGQSVESTANDGDEVFLQTPTGRALYRAHAFYEHGTELVSFRHEFRFVGIEI